MEDDDDIFLTRASPPQWLGLDQDHLTNELLPLLRGGAVELEYAE